MSWLYLPEQVEGCLPRSTCLDGERCAMSRMESTLCRCSEHGSGMDTSMTRPSGVTCGHSTDGPGVEWWIASLRGSRASRSAKRESGSASRTNAISGPTLRGSFARYDLDTSCWRTYQLCAALFENSDPILAEFLGTWPRAGTMCDGIVYQRRPLAPITRGTGYGSSVSWPTPTQADSRNTRNSTAKRNKAPPSGIHTGDTLVDAVTKWPTPTTKDNRPTSQGSREKYGAGPALSEVAGGKLNPLWVEWLMGWPIGWTGLQPLGRARFRWWLRQFGGC